MKRKRLTALIPAHNDDYTLDFCLHSIVDHFDEIVVLDDCSTDHTPDICLDLARRHGHVRYLRHEGEQQLGWIEARNRLMAETDSDWLFFLDSDDVLCEYNARLLREIAEGKAPIVRLQLCELWGDFCHTTGRLRHYDRCHVFYNRGRLMNGVWGGGSAARLQHDAGMHPARGPGPLLFHIKGVKPDRRLVERGAMRAWMRAGRPGRLEDFAGLADMSEEEIHARAMNMLLHSKQDRIRLFDGNPLPPKVILDAPTRFDMLYDEGAGGPVDRADDGWRPISWRNETP
ncbi:MAG: glycosyltransferase family 2 protein [Candidatus Brocadiae bacterium]|nr:glycosyltransferase family 2 protein [Candidatus Brocadiia bacterium]